MDGLTAPLQPASATLPQPYYPGVNGISAATASALDPNFRPNEVDSVNLTIQRQLSRKVILGGWLIGRRITHEYQPINLNAVPYMMTQGGQQFAQAYRECRIAIVRRRSRSGRRRLRRLGSAYPRPRTPARKRPNATVLRDGAGRPHLCLLQYCCPRRGSKYHSDKLHQRRGTA